MKVFICLDDDNGMLFNHRRQSRDVSVTEKIASIIGENTLYISEYSASLFQDAKVQISNNMLSDATTDDYCFVEDKNITECLDRVEQIYIFRWNRRYPSDFKFNISCLKGYEQVRTEDFSGNSHEKITLEVWKKINSQEDEA